MPARIDIATEDHDGTRVYRVEGDIDLATAPELEASLDAARDTGILVLDLSAVGFIDSTGLRSVVAAHESAEVRGSELRIVAGAKVSRLLEITGLETRLRVFDSRADAGVDG